jgi:hypothetical protein
VRAEKLNQDARDGLVIGTKREAVVRFFEEHGLPVTFANGEASGTISVMGCAPRGCGSDAALLGLRVKVDLDGTVIGAPVIGAIYIDCL